MSTSQPPIAYIEAPTSAARRGEGAAATGAAVEYFDACLCAFQQAADTRGGTLVEHRYRIGGYCIAVCFAGPVLLPVVTPALAHLEVDREDPNPPDFTICVWDSASTGVAIPVPPWGTADYGVRGEIYGYNTERISTIFQYGTDALVTLDSDRNLGLFWVEDGARVPYYETSSPLRALLHWWLRRNGRQLVHAGAVGLADGGVLLVGRGGSGKSTTALACLEAGMLYAGDDYVLLEPGPEPRVHSLYSSAKLHGDHLHRLPYLHSMTGLVSNAGALDDEKAVIFLHGHSRYRQQVGASFPVRAVLLPRVTRAAHTGVVPVSSAAGLGALAPSTIYQLPLAGGPDLQTMAAVAGGVPSYRLDLGTDVAEIPGVITGLLSRLTRAQPTL